MKNTIRTFALAAAALAAAAVAFAQADFTNVVAIGDSITAGYDSGSLHETAQASSYPKIFALQAGMTSFAQPTISEPGIPAQLYLAKLIPATITSKPGMGAPTNVTYPLPYNNLGIPGARIHDILTKKTDCGFNPAGCHQNTDPFGCFTLDPTDDSKATENPYYDLVLRGFANPTAATTAVQQAIGAHPTFVLLWVGNNDILAAVTNGTAIDNVTLTSPDAFEADLRAMVGAIMSNSSAKIVMANLPDVLDIPFATTIPRFVVNPITNQPVLDPSTGQPIPLIGMKQGDTPKPLPAGTMVTLGASALLKLGFGIPTALGGNGLPLPDGGITGASFCPGVLLYNDEITMIQGRAMALNERIAEVATELSIPVVDVHGIFHEIATNGLVYGGIKFEKDFLTGGLFSYDGIHPTSFGYAVVANEFLKTVNAGYGSRIPEVDLFPYVFGSSAEGYLVGSNPAFLCTEEAIAQVQATFAPDMAAIASVPTEPLERHDDGGRQN